MGFKWRDLESIMLQAETQQTLTLEFPSQRTAKLFRYAVYNFRRNKQHYLDFSIVINPETDPESQQLKWYLTIYKPVEIPIKEVKTEETSQDAQLSFSIQPQEI